MSAPDHQKNYYLIHHFQTCSFPPFCYRPIDSLEEHWSPGFITNAKMLLNIKHEQEQFVTDAITPEKKNRFLEQSFLKFVLHILTLPVLSSLSSFFFNFPSCREPDELQEPVQTTPEPVEPVTLPDPECCYRNCSYKATHKIKNSSSRMSKFCDFHADQQVTEMLVPL